MRQLFQLSDKFTTKSFLYDGFLDIPMLVGACFLKINEQEDIVRESKRIDCTPLETI